MNSKGIKVILIDPKARTVMGALWRLDQGESFLDLCYSWIGCDLVDVANTDDGLDLWVDDEGLMKEDRDFFEIDGYPQPLTGRAVLTGHDGQGETISAPLQSSQVKDRVLWLPHY